MSDTRAYFWKGDSELVVIANRDIGDIAVMSKRMHGEHLCERAAEIVRVLNANRPLPPAKDGEA